MAAVAHTARDAMRAAPRRRPSETPIDLVLLDIGLPDANGIALASALSGLRPAPDIIAITSERDLEMVRAAVGHGALAYLLKPFTFAAFRDRLERISATARRCRREPTPPARPRSTARWPNCGSAPTDPRPQGCRAAGPTTRSPAQSGIPPMA